MASIIWEPNVSKIVYGELIEESIFSARAIYQDADGDDYSPDGTYVYTYSGAGSGTLTAGKKLDAGNYTLTVTFDPTASALGSNITGTAPLTVEKATPAVVWNNPPDITYALYDNGSGGSVGPKLSDEQLDAITNVAGTFTYTPAKDTELDAGSQTVTAAFVPTDSTNYKGLPQGGVQLKIQFEVLKGEIQIVWPIFENGFCQEIRKKEGDPKIIPYDLKYKAEDGTGKGLARPKFLSIYKDNADGSFEAEIPGSITFDPLEDSELCDREDLVAEYGAPEDEGKFITAIFAPSNPSNWKGLVNSDGESGKDNSVLLIARHQFTIYKRISGPDIAPTMFGCWVQSVSASVGWGGTSSTCSLRLVEDPDKNAPNGEGFVWTPPEVGAACYFQYKGFYFGGVFVRWSYSDSTSGRAYDIVLESPAKLLDGVQVIMDSFEGTEYNFGTIPEGKNIPETNETGRYNRFRPSTQNPNITTEVNNVYNPLGHFENYSFGGIFGAADTNSVGFPANKLLKTIELLSCPFENEDAAFAHKCAFGTLANPDFDSTASENPVSNPKMIPQEYYKIDLSQINDIAPEHYRISGTTQSINGIISDVTELMQHDYFITLEKDPNEGKLETPAIIADEDGKAMSAKILKSTGKTREYTVNGEKKGGLTEEELLDFWKEGDDGGGLITNPNIKVVAINKGAQPAPGVIRSLVDDFKEREILMSSSIGQELQDDTTQKLIIGGPASRLVTRFIEFAYPIWAKGKDSKYFFDLYNNKSGKSYKVGDRYNIADKRIPIWVDPFGPMSSYNATIFELRMATGGRDSWQTFKVFESVFNDTYDDDPWCVDIDIDKGTLEVLAAGNRGAMSLAATKGATAGKAFNTDFQNNFNRGAAEYTDKLFSAIQNTANNFYGKMFALPMPFEPGGQDNNLRWIKEDQNWEATWEAVDSAFSVADKFNDVSFYTSEGRVKTFVEWTHNSNRDFSVLGSSYARFSGNYYNQNEDMLYTDRLAGVASTGCNIEKSHFWPELGLGPDAMPFVVMNAGERIVEYDKFTTPDFGLTVLAYYFFGIEILPEKYIGPGKANTHINIPPNVVLPNSFGVAQQSHRYVWGPWYGGTLDGKTEVIEDESLVPETFGSVEGMNQAGETLANVGNAEMTGSETGYVEIAEFPSYNIAERFAGSGPYVSDMSFTIDTGGFKTTYKFNTWTPQFGKLAKYNIDRISRINKASLALLQREREKIEKRPLFPPTPRMTADDLVRRLASSRQDVSLSLGQIFPPGGGLDGTWEVADVSVSELGPLAKGGGKYTKVAGTSHDVALIPVQTYKDKTNNNPDMSTLENPNVQGENIA